MHAPLTFLAALALGLLQCTSAIETSSQLKAKHTKSTFKALDKLFTLRRRIKRQAASECNYTLQATSTFLSFSSPNDGIEGGYGNNLQCSWTIQAPINKLPVLVFTNFSVEGIEGCVFDRVEVKDARGVITTLCGVGPNCTGNFPGNEIVGTDNILNVTFSSDYGITFPGFIALYRYVDPPYTGQPFTTTNFTHSCLLGSNTTQQNSSSAAPVPRVVPDCGLELTAGETTKRLIFHYGNSMRCQWNITAEDPMMRVAVQFPLFSVEGIALCLYDFVTVNDTRGPLSGRLCGLAPNCTGNHPNQTYASRGRNITVGLISDYSVVGDGFIMDYFSVGPMYVGGPFTSLGNASSSCNYTESGAGNGTVFDSGLINTPIIQANCSANLTATGSFQSYSLLNYHDNARCLLNFTAPPGKVLVLRFPKIDVEYGNNCMYDRIVARTSTGPGSVFCGRVEECPQQTPTHELTSSRNNATIFFFSDSSVTRQGFIVEYKSVDPGYIAQRFLPQTDSSEIPSCQTVSSSPSSSQAWGPCQINLTASVVAKRLRSPQISSTNHNYPDELRCRWNISTIPNTVVKLSFRMFDLELTTRCLYDKVEVFDHQGSLTQPLCGQSFRCSPHYPETEIISRGPYMIVVFQSDESVNFRGFTATYETVDTAYRPRNISLEITGNPNGTCPNPTQTSVALCAYNLTATEDPQVISSHDRNSSRTYQNNLRCTWNITAPLGKRVMMRFIYFDLESDSTCSYDWVSVRSYSRDVVVRRYCGNGYYCIGNFPANEDMSSNSNLLLTFKTDGSVAYSGFKAMFVAVDSSYEAQPYIPQENRTYTDRRCNVCPNQTLTLVPGRRFGVPSSNSVQGYPPDIHCRWSLENFYTSSSSLVNLTIFHYDIEESRDCQNDYIEIASEAYSIMKICGQSNQPRSFVGNPPLYVFFKSDSDLGGRGFQAKVEAVGVTPLRRRRSLAGQTQKRRNYS